MNISKELQIAVSQAAQNHEANLYDLKFVNENGMKILRVMITKNTGSVDLDTCADVSEEISSVLDGMEINDSEYYLEVCSAGAERELRSDDEILAAVNDYVFIKLRVSVNKHDEYKGDLLSFDGNVLTVAYMDKAVKRKVEINKDDIAMIRLAVRI